MTKYEVKGQIKKWYTMTEYVDTETGEIITKENYKKNYYKINIVRKIEIHENYGTIRYINECKPTGQTRIFE